jgi:hypothetical protein
MSYTTQEDVDRVLAHLVDLSEFQPYIGYDVFLPSGEFLPRVASDIVLDGNFTADQLEALAKLMRDTMKDNTPQLAGEREHSRACLAPGGVDDDICICGAHQHNQSLKEAGNGQ